MRPIWIHGMIRGSATVLFMLAFASASRAQSRQLFNEGWEFVKGTPSVLGIDLSDAKNQVRWERVALPHTANIEPVEKVAQQWQGICYYRKHFTLPRAAKGSHVALLFEAAMQEADVYLNGKPISKHAGGYLPFYVDISSSAKFGAGNVLTVRLDNRDNPLIPPGKPTKDLDFNYYSGIYRNVWLIQKPLLRITNPMETARAGWGGTWVRSENVSKSGATLVVRSEVLNESNRVRQCSLNVKVRDKAGKLVAEATMPTKTLGPKGLAYFEGSLAVQNPNLWAPDQPNLYSVTTELRENRKAIDQEQVRTGIRKVRIDKTGLYLNDQRLKIRGTNRHQDYPYIGNALSDNAQFRDAYKIKQAGFNFVRSSHYPHATAFLAACDELGLLVMDAIPGWQFVGNDVFQKRSLQDVRDMIRRDRSHPSIVLWEASLNESGMSKGFMEAAHRIVHEELPFDGVYSAGWMNDVFDVFLPARQHGKAPDYWKTYDKPRPLLIAEYGDWEYYAQNAGFNQTAFKDLKEEERTSRQLRGYGEKRLLQQALNYQEAHNDNLAGKDLGDANWLMFDYNRGYADDIESSGISDIFRLPKFSFYFYQSQADAKPMAYIANYWQKDSTTDVRVFSNCDEIELFLNDESVGRKRPDSDRNSTNLRHPPFTFNLPRFVRGSLRAEGYKNGRKVCEMNRWTPEQPSSLRLWMDTSGKSLVSGKNDVIFVYANVLDRNETIVHAANPMVRFEVSGPAELIGQNPRRAEAGIATILLRAGAKPGRIEIQARSPGLATSGMTLQTR